MPKRKTKNKQRQKESIPKPQERVRLRIRFVALCILVAMGGLLWAGYTLGPERRWEKLFSWLNRTPMQDIQGLWEHILHIEGCLIGQQDYDGTPIGKESVLNHALCQQMIHGNQEETGAFLVSRMGSQHPTAIHTCPYQNAKEGELAIYFLQHLTQANWFEYHGTHVTLQEYIHLRQERKGGKIPYEPTNTDQQLLWYIIEDAETLEELQQYYLRRLKKSYQTNDT